MLIRELATSGAAPALEGMVRFAAQRQKLLAHNVANLGTPDFRQVDASVEGFQANLRRAVEKRRERTGGQFGELALERTEELTPTGRGGEFRLTPRSTGNGILFHDRNNRSLEQLMQAQAENTMAHRVATDFLRHHNDTLRMAIGQRV